MDTPIPEFHVGFSAPDEPSLPLATDGVLRYVWHGKFGDMLVEVMGERVFVNGHKIEPFGDVKQGAVVASPSPEKNTHAVRG